MCTLTDTERQLILQNVMESFSGFTCSAFWFLQSWLAHVVFLNTRHINKTPFHSLHNPLPGNKSLKGWQHTRDAAIFLSLPSTLSLSILSNAAFLSTSVVFLCPSLSRTRSLSISVIFFLTLTATSPHLEIHNRRKAEGMKSVAVIYELLWSRRSQGCIGDGGHVCVN